MRVLLNLLICMALRADTIVAEVLYKINYDYYSNVSPYHLKIAVPVFCGNEL